MTVLDFPAALTTTGSAVLPGVATVLPGVATVQLHDDLWRVTRPDGEVLGYIERSDSSAGHRFTAKRMLQRQRRFLPIGDFWSIGDALDCFRF